MTFGLHMGNEPKTKTALLVNALGEATVHHYIRTEYGTPVVLRDELADGRISERPSTGAAFIFTCSKTGTERRWGIE